ncbi:MAG: NAD(P)-dependent alcohol dehydrogenase [Leptospira sp.]|nr:NAD(P)-dependent alcohol dehydrogenase [Leptospira sp.]
MKVFEIQNQFGIENLKLAERPQPKAGAGEVLVKIKAVSLNYRDYLTIIGQYNPRYKLPLIPGSDGAGEIVEIGTGVSNFKVGDRVIGVFAPKWKSGIPDFDQLRTTLGGPLDGTMTEYRIFSEDGVVLMPDHLSYEEASTLPCAALTAWSALAVESKINPGDNVVVLGTGGVSIFALQFAKLMGANVIVTSSSNEKLQRAKELGADHVINYNEKPGWAKEVRKITQMVGADHIIEVGGAGTLEQSLKAIRLFGHISLIGVLAGGGSNNLNLFPILMQNIRIQGIIVGSKASLESMNRAISFHKIAAGKHFGKVCIKI